MNGQNKGVPNPGEAPSASSSTRRSKEELRPEADKMIEGKRKIKERIEKMRKDRSAKS